MSIVKFTLKNEHLKLLKHLKWGIKNGYIVSGDEDDSEEININLRNEYIDLVLNGKPEVSIEVDSKVIKEMNAEELEYFDKIWEELPTAISVILQNCDVNLGTYKSKYHIGEWKEVK